MYYSWHQAESLECYL